MPDSDAPRTLSELLAELYGDERATRRVVNDVQLGAARLDLDGRPLDVWSEVVQEARISRKLDALVGYARRQYPARAAELDAAAAAHAGAAGDGARGADGARAAPPGGPREGRAPLPSPR